MTWALHIAGLVSVKTAPRRRSVSLGLLTLIGLLGQPRCCEATAVNGRLRWQRIVFHRNGGNGTAALS